MMLKNNNYIYYMLGIDPKKVMYFENAVSYNMLFYRAYLAALPTL